jgi:hypothetical protein
METNIKMQQLQTLYLHPRTKTTGRKKTDEREPRTRDDYNTAIFTNPLIFYLYVHHTRDCWKYQWRRKWLATATTTTISGSGGAFEVRMW